MICTCVKFRIFSKWQIFAVGLRTKKLELFQIWSYYVPFESSFTLIDNLIRTRVTKLTVKKLLVFVSFHHRTLKKKKIKKISP